MCREISGKRSSGLRHRKLEADYALSGAVKLIGFRVFYRFSPYRLSSGKPGMV